MIILSVLVLGCQTEEQSNETIEEHDKVAQEKIAPNIVNNDEVRVLGEEGFDKYEIRVKVGESVRFINDNPTKQIVTLVFKKNVKLTNSGLIEYKQSYVKEFDEPGAYDFWTVGHGIEGKIIVEE